MYQKTNGNNVEKKVLDIMLDHARTIQSGANTLAEIIDCWKTPGRVEFNKQIKLLNTLETKANSMKKDAMKEISDAGPSLLFRQDLMRIIRILDQIIDLGQGAAYFLDQLKIDWLPPQDFVDNLMGLTEKTQKATKLLVDLIRALYQSLDKVIEISEEIEILENNADSNYRYLIIELAKINAPNEISVLIRESIDRIEDMVDSARDVASFIRIYAMSR
ncbi:MAG: DUF47 family protein [Asgard group archaeon]|nr:DUF47 family protein [Asgard group archaeon]